MTIISDDAVNIEKRIYEKELIEIVKIFYYKNSRVFCDTLAHLIYRIPFDLWKMLDSFVYLLIDILITANFTKANIVDFVFVSLLLLLFPIDILSSAGYIASSTNYVYTILGILIIVHVIKRIKLKDNVSIVNFLPVILIPYVCNQDQTAFALIAILVYCTIYYSFFNIANKNCISTIIFYLLISIISYGIYLYMPGHQDRMIDYMSPFSAPNYIDWTIIDKMYHGVSSTIAYILYDEPLIVIVFSIMLAYYFINKKDRKNAFLSSVFIIYELFVKIIGKSFFITRYEYTYGLPEIGQLNIKNTMILIFSMLILFLFSYLIFKIENNNKYIILFGCILGCLSHIAMGFSRTIYGSSFRTFTFFYYSLFCSITILFNLNNKTNKTIPLLLLCCMVIIN